MIKIRKTNVAFRSISLVGEGERKLLKEIVKQARSPVKSRVIAQETITKFRQRLADFSDDLTDILKLEKEEKEVRISCILILSTKNRRPVIDSLTP